MRNDPRLMPVDKAIKQLQIEVDKNLWEDTNSDVSFQERDRKWFMFLRDKGIIYDTTF